MTIPEFGTLVRTARVKRGLTLREAARKVGIDPSRLWRIEQGDRPPPPLPELRALADILDLSLADLLVAGGTSKAMLESLLWASRLSFGGREDFTPHHPDLWRKNTFVAKVLERRGAKVVVEAGQERLTALSFSAANALRVTIPPEAVLVMLGDVPRFAEANLLRARVAKSRMIGQLTNVVLACRGVELNSLLVGEQSLRPETEVWVAIPPAAIRTLPVEEEKE